MKRLSDASIEELEEVTTQAGEPPFRARQVREWMIRHGRFMPSEMSNIPDSFKTILAEHYPCPPLQLERDADSSDGTLKRLLRLSDGQLVESVLIPTARRMTVCLSSQVGCPVRCGFCASGIEGGKRNLSSGEILEQFMAMRDLAEQREKPITNLVMMGMGEPMLNYDNVFHALKVINSKEGVNFGARRITVSTIGIEKGVRRFAEAGTQYTLAFSLHAPDDETREKIVPLRSAMKVSEIRDWALKYLETTGREVTFEYVMLDGINSGPEHGRKLVELMRGVRATVNLIPYNPVPGLPYSRPSDAAIDEFHDLLIRNRVKVNLRRRRGADIDAACGQLALKTQGS